MKNKKYVLIAGIVCAIIFLIPNIAYLWNFSKLGLSPDPERWGQYGDFIGGFTNPILTILNIIALVFLTLTVSDIEKERIKEEREIERLRIEEQQKIEDNRAKESITVQKVITLSQMRYNAIVELSKTLDTFIDFIEEIRNEKKETFLIISSSFGSFRSNTKHLFEKLYTQEFNTNFYEPLRISISDLSTYVADTEITALDMIRLDELIRVYIPAKAKFIQELNSYVIQELSVKEEREV